MNKVAIVIPSYNEEHRLASTLEKISKAVSSKSIWEYEFIVVDDASFTPVTIEHDKFSIPVHLLRHPINLGQGAALGTAFEYCRSTLKSDYVITMDADGQHCADDIFHFLATCQQKDLDIVFGNRFVETSNIPMLRIMLLKAAMCFEFLMSGLKLSDAHNGFRVMNKRALQIMHVNQNRMAHATEIKLLTAKHKLKYGEVPTTILYSQETLAKGQSSLGTFVILRDLFKNYLFDR